MKVYLILLSAQIFSGCSISSQDNSKGRLPWVGRQWSSEVESKVFDAYLKAPYPPVNPFPKDVEDNLLKGDTYNMCFRLGYSLALCEEVTFMESVFIDKGNINGEMPEFMKGAIEDGILYAWKENSGIEKLWEPIENFPQYDKWPASLKKSVKQFYQSIPTKSVEEFKKRFRSLDKSPFMLEYSLCYYKIGYACGKAGLTVLQDKSYNAGLNYSRYWATFEGYRDATFDTGVFLRPLRNNLKSIPVK